MANPKALIVRAPGANCDGETQFALELAGARAERIHINRLRENPGLFQDLGEDQSQFLEAARLSAVLLLLLTRTVHSIELLELMMHSPTELAVKFKGIRPPRYAREEPQEIEVEGICKLVSNLRIS